MPAIINWLHEVYKYLNAFIETTPSVFSGNIRPLFNFGLIKSLSQVFTRCLEGLEIRFSVLLFKTGNFNSLFYAILSHK